MSGDQTSRDQMGMEIKRECAVGDQMGMEIECPRSNVRDQMSGDQMSRDQMRTTRLLHVIYYHQTTGWCICFRPRHSEYSTAARSETYGPPCIPHWHNINSMTYSF